MSDPTALATPWLSILIPIYNVEAYLAECVESVMLQADAGVEVLLLDDCSTDGSATVMHALEQRWPGRLRLLRHAHNQGLSAARNTMIEAAQGEYLWFLDSDDKLLPGAIFGLQAIVKEHHPDIVLCDYRVWRTHTTWRQRIKGEWHRRTFRGPARQLRRHTTELVCGILLGGEAHAWSKISKRTLWKADLQFPAGMYFEDMATIPQLALAAASYYYQPSPWIAYRQHVNSILSTMNPQKIRDWSQSLQPFRNKLATTSLGDVPDVQYALAHACARNLRGALQQLQQLRAHMAPQERQELARTLLHDFQATSPLDLSALLRAYGRRFAFSRRRRLQRTTALLQALAHP